MRCARYTCYYAQTAVHEPRRAGLEPRGDPVAGGPQYRVDRADRQQRGPAGFGQDPPVVTVLVLRSLAVRGDHDPPVEPGVHDAPVLEWETGGDGRQDVVNQSKFVIY